MPWVRKSTEFSLRQRTSADEPEYFCLPASIPRRIRRPILGRSSVVIAAPGSAPAGWFGWRADRAGRVKSGPGPVLGEAFVDDRPAPQSLLVSDRLAHTAPRCRGTRCISGPGASSYCPIVAREGDRHTPGPGRCGDRARRRTRDLPGRGSSHPVLMRLAGSEVLRGAQGGAGRPRRPVSRVPEHGPEGQVSRPRGHL
jgi:hypothetical protein